MLRKYRSVMLLAALVMLPGGCNTPDTIADFCDSSNQAVASAVPIFGDLGPSCLRVKNLEKGIGSFEVATSDPQCDAVEKQSEAAVDAAQVLADYFAALHALAAFDTGKPASDANDLAVKVAGVAGLSADVQTAVGSMAKFLITAATSGYQMKSLNKDVAQANKNVAVVTDALVGILQTNYVNQELGNEENKLMVHYKEFAVAHPDGQVAVLLDERWHADREKVEARREAALSAILALQSIKAGMGSLAANASTLKAKEIPGLLDPYVTQLEDLIPQIQAAF